MLVPHSDSDRPTPKNSRAWHASVAASVTGNHLVSGKMVGFCGDFMAGSQLPHCEK